jgi:hypothetical protein
MVYLGALPPLSRRSLQTCTFCENRGKGTHENRKESRTREVGKTTI